MERTGLPTEVVLEKRAGNVGEALRKTAEKLGVEEDVQARAGHVIQLFGKVHSGLSMLNYGGGHA